MLATWQEHRGSYVGVKATGDTYGVLPRSHRAGISDQLGEDCLMGKKQPDLRPAEVRGN
jgi:hypothetical protein